MPSPPWRGASHYVRYFAGYHPESSFPVFLPKRWVIRESFRATFVTRGTTMPEPLRPAGQPCARESHGQLRSPHLSPWRQEVPNPDRDCRGGGGQEEDGLLEHRGAVGRPRAPEGPGPFRPAGAAAPFTGGGGERDGHVRHRGIRGGSAPKQTHLRALKGGFPMKKSFAITVVVLLASAMFLVGVCVAAPPELTPTKPFVGQWTGTLYHVGLCFPDTSKVMSVNFGQGSATVLGPASFVFIYCV